MGIFTAVADIVPSRVAALGIEFGQVNQAAYLLMFAAVILHFILAFFFCGRTDYLNWDYKYENYKMEVEAASDDWSREQQAEYDETRYRYAQQRSIVDRSHAVARWRINLEFFFPLPGGCICCDCIACPRKRLAID